MIYRLKPLPVDVYVWDGVIEFTTLPDWVGPVLMGAIGTFMIVRLPTQLQAVLSKGWALMRYPSGTIVVMAPEEIDEKVEVIADAPAPAPVPTPVPLPTTSVTMPAQPWTPLDRVTAGVDLIVGDVVSLEENPKTDTMTAFKAPAGASVLSAVSAGTEQMVHFRSVLGFRYVISDADWKANT